MFMQKPISELRQVQHGVEQLQKLRRDIGTSNFLVALGAVTTEQPIGFRDFPVGGPGEKIPVLNIGRIPVFTQLTDGGEKYTSIERPEGVVIVPIIFERGVPYVVLIEIERGSVNDKFTEVPAGQLIPGESARDCAEREIGEETGFKIVKVIRDFGAISHSGPDFTTDGQRTIVVEVMANGGRDMTADDKDMIKRVFMVPLAEAARAAAYEDRLPENERGDTKSTRAILATARILGV